MVAYQGGEFEILIAGPGADFSEFGSGQERVIRVAADEVGLLTDRLAMVSDLLGRQSG